MNNQLIGALECSADPEKGRYAAWYVTAERRVLLASVNLSVAKNSPKVVEAFLAFAELLIEDERKRQLGVAPSFLRQEPAEQGDAAQSTRH